MEDGEFVVVVDMRADDDQKTLEMILDRHCFQLKTTQLRTMAVTKKYTIETSFFAVLVK